VPKKKEILMTRTSSNYIKTIALFTLLFSFLCCSGCATILGGIIGYQSGELAAGAAIGAAIDFGGDIVNGIGYILTDEKTRFEQTVSLDSEQGEIKFTKSNFPVKKMDALLRKLEKKFDKAGWAYTLIQKKRSTGRTLLLEKWACADPTGREFELSILQEKCKDVIVTIAPVNGDAALKNEITIQIYNWLKQAALNQ
jgi:hypothetical protein